MSAFDAPPRDGGRAATTPPQHPRPTPVPRVASPALEALVADPTPERRAAFARRLAQEGTPLVEEAPGRPDERVYTFVHRDDGTARRVLVDVNKLVDAGRFADALMAPVPGTPLWSLSLRMPAAWRASYGVAVDDGSPVALPEHLAVRRERARAAGVAPDAELDADLDGWYDLRARSAPDPLAREHALLGDASVASGPAAPALPAGVAGLTVGEQPDPGAPRGRTARVEGFGDRQADRQAGPQAWWHVPPVTPGPEGWDVLVLLDGDRWRGPGLRALDQAYVAGHLRPAVVLLVGCGDTDRRLADLTCSREYVDALVDLVDHGAPPTDSPVTRDPARTTIAGSSLGGLTALWAQCVAPQRFGASVCQSGSWWWPTRPTPGEWLTGAIEQAVQDPGGRFGRVHLEVGTGEWVLREPTARLRAVLDGRCERLTYREFDGGHDAACWAVQLLEVLAADARTAHGPPA